MDPPISIIPKQMTTLTIEKFKRIREKVSFTNLAFVNYFVGENGSGKTSILNAVSFLRDGGNSRHFFGPESVVELNHNGTKQFLFWNIANPNKTEDRGDLNPNIYILISNFEGEKGANGLKGKAKIDDRIGVGNAQSLEKLNAFLKESGMDQLTARKFVDQTDPFNQDNGRLIFENEHETIDPSFIADGLTAVYNLKGTLREWADSVRHSSTVNLLIIEEPENNLHPNLQKEIPKLLNDFYKGLDRELAKHVFFFISTHSPFIISAAANYENQKVYPLQNGKPLEINLHNLSWTETDKTEGYSGAECAYVVSKMLGADITDLGYPENYCVLEEYSLQVILDNAREKGIIKNIQFVSASGVTKSLDLADKIYELEKLNTLVKCNPYYFDKYYLIIDNIEALDLVLKERVERIGGKLRDRFKQLTLASLEDYYSNLDVDFAREAKENIASLQDRQSVGKAKELYAFEISKKILDREAFSRLFNGELDFLLKVID
ncbi:MAG TPA: AAA family ATPase [Pyrinomonadaceae bacterium]|jgi:predicted ATPase|nr:AAA family ATPase [Pyrinomonadaceae bacterium]